MASSGPLSGQAAKDYLAKPTGVKKSGGGFEKAYQGTKYLDPAYLKKEAAENLRSARRLGGGGGGMTSGSSGNFTYKDLANAQWGMQDPGLSPEGRQQNRAMAEFMRANPQAMEGGGGGSSARMGGGRYKAVTAYDPTKAISALTKSQAAQNKANLAYLTGLNSRNEALAREGAKMADPWAPQRAQYVTALNTLMQQGETAIASDPSAQFRFRKGQQALESSMAAKGLLGSGNAALELQKYGQEAASEEYGKQYERLAELSGMRKSDPVAAAQLLSGANKDAPSTFVNLAQSQSNQMADLGRYGIDAGFKMQELAMRQNELGGRSGGGGGGQVNWMQSGRFS